MRGIGIHRVPYISQVHFLGLQDEGGGKRHDPVPGMQDRGSQKDRSWDLMAHAFPAPSPTQDFTGNKTLTIAPGCRFTSGFLPELVSCGRFKLNQTASGL